MPPKVRDLERSLQQAGFIKRAAKEAHRKWIHPKGVVVIMSGKRSADAKPYQKTQIEKALREIKR